MADYALINCRILNGRKDMQVEEGKMILIHDNIIERIDDLFEIGQI